MRAWRQALKKRKLSAPKSYVGKGDWTEESGRREALVMISLDKRPTAIFAANFPMLTGVLRALKERGLRCPGDVEVASSDDSDWLDAFEPPVTTVVQPAYALGEHAADLLLKRIREPGRAFQKIVLAPELRVRS